MYETSIIIPHLDNVPRLMKCLDAIYTQICDKTEVLLIDNGTRDLHPSHFEKYDRLYFYSVTDIKSPYHCRNYGIKKAKGDLLVLCDSNCIPNQKWFETGLRLVSESLNMIVSGPIIFEIDDNSSSFEIADALGFTPQKDSYIDGRSYPGGHLFMHRMIFEKIGYFPIIRSGGDILWTEKAVRSGYVLGYDENISVSYPPKKKHQIYKKSYRIGKGYVERNKLLKERNSFQMIVYSLKLAIPPHPLNHLNRFTILMRSQRNILKIIFSYFILFQCRIIRSYAILKEVVYYNE